MQATEGDRRLAVRADGRNLIGHAGVVLRKAAAHVGLATALSAAMPQGTGPGWWDHGWRSDDPEGAPPAQEQDGHAHRRSSVEALGAGQRRWRPMVSGPQLDCVHGNMWELRGNGDVMRISMAGQGAEEELRSLRAWLLESPEIRAHAKVSWEAGAPNQGEMGGGAIEALQLITDNAWQVATFSLSYAAWRKTRARNIRVTIEREGKSVTIESHDSETVERITQALADE